MAEDDEQVTPGGPYADHRVPLVHNELAKYSVGIVPILPDMKNLDPSGAGSGTCVRIGQRFFIATCAHVIMGRPHNQHFLLTPTTKDWSLRIVGGNYRGGGERDNDDVGWLELHGRAAAISGREFLDVARMRTHCLGDEDLLFMGCAQQDAEVGRHEDGTPTFRVNGSWWPTRGIFDPRDLADALEPNRKMFLKWSRLIKGHNEHWYERPAPKGMSGGGIWAPNYDQSPWRPEFMQLVGIEYAVQRQGVPDQYLKAFQIQVWLEMLKEDLPELAPFIDPLLAAGRAWTPPQKPSG